MQRISILLVLIIFMNFKLIAQEKRELNWQDFKNSIQKTDVAKPVKWGTLTIFQIKDINKFLYKVTIAGRVFDLQTPIPSELQTLFRLTPSELQKTATNTKTQEAATQAGTGVEKVTKVLEATSGERIARADNSPVGPLEQALGDLKDSYQKYLDKVKQLSMDVLALKRSRNQLISIAQKDLSFANIAVELFGVNWPIVNIESNYSDVKDQFLQTGLAIETTRNLAKENEDIKAVVEAIATNLKKADAFIEEEALLSIIDEVNFLYTELGNENNFIVNAPPVQMDGDLISYEVTITPTSTKSLAPFRNPMKFTFEVPAKKGVKVDFSVGPAVSFGDNAKDEKYFLKETDNVDTVMLRNRPNNNSLSPGIAAFMHVYSRSGKWASLGGVFGVGAGFQNTSDVNLSLYIGLTAVMGKSQKVTGSIGVSYLKVQRIKNDQFEANKKYAVSKIELGQVTEAVFKPSVFIAISYNLSSRTEINK